jgi:type IV secretory pathway VirB2 component (pilin)
MIRTIRTVRILTVVALIASVFVFALPAHAAPPAAPSLDVISDMLNGIITGLKTVGTLVAVVAIMLYAIQMIFPGLLQKIGINMPQDFLFGLLIAGLIFSQAQTIASAVFGGGS